MKLTYITLIGLLIFSSCSSNDDNNDNGTGLSVIGTWNGIARQYNGEDLDVSNYNIIIFSSDKRMEFIYEGFGNNGEDISEFGDWNKSENTITITWDESDPGSETYVLQVLELTETTLVWTGNSEGTFTEAFEK